MIQQHHRRADGQAGHGAVQAAGHDARRPGVALQHALGRRHAQVKVLGRLVHLMGDGLHIHRGGRAVQGAQHVLGHVAAEDAGLRGRGDLRPVQGQGQAGGQPGGQMHVLHQRHGRLIPAAHRAHGPQVIQPRAVQGGQGDAPHVLPGEVRAHRRRGNVPLRRPVDGLGQHLAAQERHHAVIRLQVGQGRVQPVRVQGHVHPGQQPRGRQGQQIIAQVVGPGPPGHSVAGHCPSPPYQLPYFSRYSSRQRFSSRMISACSTPT